MGGNSNGAYRTSPVLEMLVFDVLPPAIRAGLREAVFDWPPTAILDELRRGKSVRTILAAIAINDRLEVEDLARERAAG
jgi:hypothetical protein